MKYRVAITGIGVFSPIGNDVDQLLDSLQSGRSGIVGIENLTLPSCSDFVRSIIEPFLDNAWKEGMDREMVGTTDSQMMGFLKRYLVDTYTVHAKPSRVRYVGMVRHFDPLTFLSPKDLKKTDRFQQLALAASEMSKKNAGYDSKLCDYYASDRVAVVAGSSMGGMQTWEDSYRQYLRHGIAGLNPYFMTKFPADMAAGEISRHQEVNGPIESCGAACATGTLVVGRAFELIREGSVDAAFATASEASLSHLGLAGFEVIKALSTRDYGDPQRASRPFDRERSGFIMSEGAASLFLERLDHAQKRGARIYAEITGFGNYADAYHPTRPNPEGKYAAQAMEHALRDGQINKEAVNYINAHGTSTSLNDKIETLAIKRVFGCDRANKIAVSSTKSLSGHLMGAAGAFEAAICALALYHEFVPPTINYEYPAPECDLADYVPNQAREAKLKVALSNSFGFGGRDATIALKRLQG